MTRRCASIAFLSDRACAVVRAPKRSAHLLRLTLTGLHQLRWATLKPGERRSLRKISADLAAAGFVNERGKPYHAQSIMRMIEEQRPD